MAAFSADTSCTPSARCGACTLTRAAVRPTSDGPSTTVCARPMISVHLPSPSLRSVQVNMIAICAAIVVEYAGTYCHLSVLALFHQHGLIMFTPLSLALIHMLAVLPSAHLNIYSANLLLVEGNTTAFVVLVL